MYVIVASQSFSSFVAGECVIFDQQEHVVLLEAVSWPVGFADVTNALHQQVLIV
jgi:hypothetical protein